MLDDAAMSNEAEKRKYATPPPLPCIGSVAIAGPHARPRGGQQGKYKECRGNAGEVQYYRYSRSTKNLLEKIKK
eukprot:COSAG05_NODE_1047_length_6041_cov_141.646247_7_plen_74_part_00